jgi:hypothetical protein
MTKVDDWAIGIYLSNRSFHWPASGGGHFMGHSMDRQLISILGNGTLPSMPNCSDVSHDRGGLCGWFPSPLNDLVFAHMYPRTSFQYLLEAGNIMFNAKPEIFWWSDIRGIGLPALCYQDNPLMLGRSTLWDQPKTKWGNHSWY